MRTLIVVLAVLCATVAGTAGVSAQEPDGHTPDPAITDGSAAKALAAAKARWRSSGPASYRFRVRRSCFCAPDSTRAVTITVRAGRPVSPPQVYVEVATVPRLFRVVRRAIDDGAARLRVTYDRRTGFPRGIAIDGRTMVADDEISYDADRLERLKPRR